MSDAPDRGTHDPREQPPAASVPSVGGTSGLPVSFVDLLQPPPPDPVRRPMLRPAVTAGVVVVVAVSAWFGFGGGEGDPRGDPDSYAFSELQADGVTPAAFDPCVPIHYVTRPDNEPRNGQRLVTEAVARVSLATGLTFVDDGAPDPGVVGDPEPVLITWETSSENPDLDGDVVGLGGPSIAVLGDGTRVLVSGTVSLEASELDSMTTLWGGQDMARAVIMHELAHVVGLAHVDDESQIMAPTTSRSVTEFGAGDLAGLRILGQGACVDGHP